MKRFSFVFLLIFLVPGSALASNYNQALSTASPLAPANKPFKNQPGYSKTAPFKNFNDFNQDLVKKVKAKEKYDSKRFSSARETANKKITNNLKEIASLQSEAVILIRQAADQRTTLLRDSLFKDYQVGFNSIRSNYFKKLKSLTKKRNISYQKNRKVTLSKLKKAYTSSSQKRVRARYQKTVTKIRRYYYLKVKSLRSDINSSAARHMDKFKSQFSKTYSQVRSQAARSIEILNKRTDAQLLILRKEKLSVASSLRRLSGRKSVSLIDLSVKNASLSQAISPISYPVEPTVLNDWPDLNTPTKYLISKNYLPKNVIAFQNRQTKNICSLGSSYFQNVKKYQDSKKRVQTSAQSVKDARTNYSILNKDYQRANDFYLEKKRIYKKEQKLRLKRPDDTLLIRAKNRYLEAKSALASAKESLGYGRLNLKDSVSLYNKYRAQTKTYLVRAKKARSSQKRLIKKTELYSKAKRSCSKLVL